MISSHSQVCLSGSFLLQSTIIQTQNRVPSPRPGSMASSPFSVRAPDGAEGPVGEQVLEPGRREGLLDLLADLRVLRAELLGDDEREVLRPRDDGQGYAGG